MVTASDPALNALAADVQHNCDISDARYAREYTMCIYLLKMRELFRWEKGYGYADRLPKEELGDWLTAREAHWEALETREYVPLRLDGDQLDAFADDPINAALTERGLVYSGGIGAWHKPHFFLAELQRREPLEGKTVFVAGRELARDITAPPAMTRGSNVFVRSESLRRMIWEKVEEWQWKKEADHPVAHLVKAYRFDEGIESALDRLTEDEIDTLVLHELGEIEAGGRLGPAWERMLSEAGRTPLELVARAVRDHLADCLVTLPRLLARDDPAALYFYMANLTGMRRELFPLLKDANRTWLREGKIEPLLDAVERGRGHWEAVGRRLLDDYQREGRLPTIEPADIAL